MYKYVCWVLGCFFTLPCMSQNQPDSLFTTKGAVTIVTSKQPVITFQLGDGKNADYDYRVVDGNMILVRAVAPNPRPTNVVIREGKAVHYFILGYKEHLGIEKLKYAISDEIAVQLATPPTIFLTGSIKRSDLAPINSILSKLPIITATEIIDTVIFQRIAQDFGKYHKASRKYKVRETGVTTHFVTALTLNGYTYFSFRIFNRQLMPLEFCPPVLLSKPERQPGSMKAVPVIFQRPTEITSSGCSEIVFVTKAWRYMKKEQLILLLKAKNTDWKAALYLPVKVL